MGCSEGVVFLFALCRWRAVIVSASLNIFIRVARFDFVLLFPKVSVSFFT